MHVHDLAMIIIGIQMWDRWKKSAALSLSLTNSMFIVSIACGLLSENNACRRRRRFPVVVVVSNYCLLPVLFVIADVFSMYLAFFI